jgi:hypothetical protein
MGKRTEHTFQFTAEQIAKAATAEFEYHAKRAVWWASEHETAVTEAKTKGVEVRRYPVTGGDRAAITIDPTLAKRVEESFTKRTDHQRKADRFRIEAAAYGSQSAGCAYALDSDDVVYFRLAGGPREEDAA